MSAISTIVLTWNQLKTLINSLSLSVVYWEDNVNYYVTGVSLNFSSSCVILKDGGPDQIDFETNYKPTANPVIANNVTVTSASLPENAAKETGGNLASINAGLETLNSLVPSVYDYIDLSYTGNDLTTVVFKVGGSGGVTVSTLSLTYDGNSNLLTVTKS